MTMGMKMSVPFAKMEGVSLCFFTESSCFAYGRKLTRQQKIAVTQN